MVLREGIEPSADGFLKVFRKILKQAAALSTELPQHVEILSQILTNVNYPLYWVEMFECSSHRVD